MAGFRDGADVQQAFDAWANVTNITFTLVGSTNTAPGDYYQQTGGTPGSVGFADITVEVLP